jgi:hypothetical protein
LNGWNSRYALEFGITKWHGAFGAHGQRIGRRLCIMVVERSDVSRDA